jgi:pimeloyl-ACP methyl ester carboxylesterase
MSFPAHSARFGSGPRDVLAFHCTMAHGGAWRPLAAAMEGEARITAMDMPSHGRSPDWDEAGDFHDLVTGAAEELLHPGMDLVGHSFGASIALRLALQHPEKVRTLTLIEPVIFSVALQDDPEAVAEHDAGQKAYRDAMEARNLPLAARIFNRDWGDGTKWDDMPERTRTALVRGVHIVPASAPALVADAKGFLAPGALDRLTIPALMLYGSESMRVIGVVCDGLAHRMPAARSTPVPGAGHMLPITHPHETAAELRSLFAEA